MNEASKAVSVAIVGGGASGTLTAIHLARAAARRSTGVHVTMVDPTPRWGRGVAFGTMDGQHLLNVPAADMSAFPEDPAHFVAWLETEHPEGQTNAVSFVPRRLFGQYLDDTLVESFSASRGLAQLRHVRETAVGYRRTATAALLVLANGTEVRADAVVLATGLPRPGEDWAPESLRGSPFFVPDPWAPGAIEMLRRDRVGPGDVLLVGSGLTMVDMALSLSGPGNRCDRNLHAVSRSGRLPRSHSSELKLATIPDIEGWGQDLCSIRDHAIAHLKSITRETGDWRPVVDGLRAQLPTLWGRLSAADRAEFLRRDASGWNNLRHRMAPVPAVVMAELRAAGRLSLESAEVTHAESLSGGGLRVELSSGAVRDVGWVVNCTGPRLDVRELGDPLVDDLLRPRAGTSVATAATAGMGLQTHEGRVRNSQGGLEDPLWALGALRRGELWESTAVPEIRTQARSVAVSILEAVAPLPRRLADGRLVNGHHPVARPRDPLGLPLSTTADAAAAFNAGLERVMRLQEGGAERMLQATELDPGFAIAHAALAMLGHEGGAAVNVGASLRRAHRAASVRADDRERSFVQTVSQRVADVRGAGARALLAHIAQHPRDVLAVSAAVPTIAFSGVTDIQQEAWDLVEGLGSAYGDHWWYISLLAFTRQDQGRFDEAGQLAESALSCEPSSGHSVHAASHVNYETGQHESGRAWLDHWVAESGRSASHRAHFSWHAALHELSLGDTEAVRRRYYTQLMPPTVTGVRALVDTASLLWRWHITTSAWDDALSVGLSDRHTAAFPGECPIPPIDAVLRVVDEELRHRPQTPFVALHAALVCAVSRDLATLHELRRHCRTSSDPTMRTTVAAVCSALLAAGEERWADAAGTLSDVQPGLARVGGSAAQREIIEETLLYCLVRDGQAERARALLDGRLGRRSSPLDLRRCQSLQETAAFA